jgi:hypothetical protein
MIWRYRANQAWEKDFSGTMIYGELVETACHDTRADSDNMPSAFLQIKHQKLAREVATSNLFTVPATDSKVMGPNVSVVLARRIAQISKICCF